ncbi:HlyD family secretion protein [Aquabacterium sp. A7-Y]|uniref:HlyD family secretion protein n=1 Tax=Aquabacterium sp. A7-Y TaxID=1349605 RepID=UPI00223DA7EA|nr:HlyD family efflux transporter periplasmic adaptor subunit [Aquabacterium sp. A7-Y]MCW7538196.1 HlyD family secretion protein [Aquabacterium sp. A7-Y]
MKTTRLQEAFRKTGLWGKAAAVAVFALVPAAYVFGWGSREITSQAFINAPIVVLRSPIPGRTQLAPRLQVGTAVRPGDTLGVVLADTENARVSGLRTLLADLQTRARTLETEQAALEARIQSRQTELQQLRVDVQLQKSVELAGARAELTVSSSEIARASAEQEQAQQGATRAVALLQAGFISQEGYEKMLREQRVAAAATAVERARLLRAEAALRAAQSGLQLDGPRSLPYVQTRARELGQELVDLRARLQQAQSELAANRTEAGVIEAELQQQREARLASPVHGAVWGVESNTGDSVDHNGAVLRLIDCRAPWVEAFLKESEVEQLRPGQAVRVRSLQSGAQWSGVVETVRAGTGRVSVGQYVVDPPPEVMRRQLPVRVATARIRVNWTTALPVKDFCGAGSSVSVHRAG